MIQPQPEQVYVVPRATLFAGDAPQGCVRLESELLQRIYQDGFFAERGAVEEDPSLKQIIPYALVTRGRSTFTFRRTKGGGEKRLFGRRSVGVGGHVNPVDADDVVLDALSRELHEELFLPDRWNARLVGLINDDETAVGSVHLGVVAVVDVGPGLVKVREMDTMTGGFLGQEELLSLHASQRDSFEGWSALLLDRLDEVLTWQPPVSSIPIPKKAPTSTT